MKQDSARASRARSTTRNDPTRAAGLVFGGLVTVVAAVASYSHQHELAARYGEQWLSWLLPLSVDGLLVVASLAIVTARRFTERVPRLAVLALVVGVLVSLVANIAAAGPSWGSRIIAAWPPIAFAGAFELVLWLTKATRGRQVAAVVDGVDEPVEELTDDELSERMQTIYQEQPEIGERPLAQRLGVKRYRVQAIKRQWREQQHAPLHAVGGEQ